MSFHSLYTELSAEIEKTNGDIIALMDAYKVLMEGDGILLCKEKKDAQVELTLPKDFNIYAAQYQLYLPDKKLLQEKLKSWIEEFDESEL